MENKAPEKQDVTQEVTPKTNETPEKPLTESSVNTPDLNSAKTVENGNQITQPPESQQSNQQHQTNQQQGNQHCDDRNHHQQLD